MKYHDDDIAALVRSAATELNAMVQIARDRGLSVTFGIETEADPRSTTVVNLRIERTGEAL